MKEQEIQSSMNKSVEATQRNFNTIRTGRANASLLDRISVEYYGCLLYTSPSPRDGLLSRMPSSA